MLGIISVLRLEATGSPSELIKEPFLVFLLEDLSGMFTYWSIAEFKDISQDFC